MSAKVAAFLRGGGFDGKFGASNAEGIDAGEERCSCVHDSLRIRDNC